MSNLLNVPKGRARGLSIDADNVYGNPMAAGGDKPLSPATSNLIRRSVTSAVEKKQQIQADQKTETKTRPQLRKKSSRRDMIEEKVRAEMNAGAGALDKFAHWVCDHAYFHRVCDTIFKDIDLDGGGELDFAEVYAGVLLVSSTLATFVCVRICDVATCCNPPALHEAEGLRSNVRATNKGENTCHHQSDRCR